MSGWKGKILEKAQKILLFVIEKSILIDISIATFAFALLMVIQHFSKHDKSDDQT